MTLTQRPSGVSVGLEKGTEFSEPSKGGNDGKTATPLSSTSRVDSPAPNTASAFASPAGAPGTTATTVIVVDPEAEDHDKGWWKTALLMGCGFIGNSVMDALFSQYVPVLLQSDGTEAKQNDKCGTSKTKFQAKFALTPILVYTIISLSNLLGAISNISFGRLSDKVKAHPRLGRRKPFILTGVLICCVAFVLMVVVRQLWLVVIFILLRNVGAALWLPPIGAWLGDLFPSTKRSKADGVILFLCGISVAIAVVVGGAVSDSKGVYVTFLLFAAVSLALVLMPIVLIHEPEFKDASKRDSFAVSSDQGLATSNVPTPATNSTSPLAPGAEASSGGRTCQDGDHHYRHHRQAGLFQLLIASVAGFFQNMAEALLSVYNTPHKIGVCLLLSYFWSTAAVTGFQNSLSSFTTLSLGLTSTETSVAVIVLVAAFLLSLIPFSRFRTPAGRWIAVQAGALFCTVCLFIGYVAVWDEMSEMVSLLLLLAAVGGGAACASVNIFPLIFDATGVKDKSGRTKSGTTSGLYYFTGKLGNTIGPLVIGAFVQATRRYDHFECGKPHREWGSHRMVWLIAGVGGLLSTLTFRLGHAQYRKICREELAAETVDVLSSPAPPPCSPPSGVVVEGTVVAVDGNLAVASAHHHQDKDCEQVETFNKPAPAAEGGARCCSRASSATGGARCTETQGQPQHHQQPQCHMTTTTTIGPGRHLSGTAEMLLIHAAPPAHARDAMMMAASAAVVPGESLSRSTITSNGD